MNKRLCAMLAAFSLIFMLMTATAAAEGLLQDVLPVVTKHPIEETVEAGGNCSFIVNADNFTKVEWFFHKGNVTIRAEDAEQYFPGLTVENADECEIILISVPKAMNGWTAGATFSNDEGRIKTSYCPINVIGGVASAPSPTPAPTPKITPEPTAAPTPKVTEAPKENVPIETQTMPEVTDKGEKGTNVLAFVFAAIGAAVCIAAVIITVGRKKQGKTYKSRH